MLEKCGVCGKCPGIPLSFSFGEKTRDEKENSCNLLDLWYNNQKYVLVMRDDQQEEKLMAENKQYITQAQEGGTVMVSEDVIATIVEHTLTEVDGVVKGGTEVIGKKHWGKGIRIFIAEDNSLSVGCNVIVAYGQSVVDVAKAVQSAVAAALESITGVAVKDVSVNVCGISKN